MNFPEINFQQAMDLVELENAIGDVIEKLVGVPNKELLMPVIAKLVNMRFRLSLRAVRTEEYLNAMVREARLGGDAIVAMGGFANDVFELGKEMLAEDKLKDFEQRIMMALNSALTKLKSSGEEKTEQH